MRNCDDPKVKALLAFVAARTGGTASSLRSPSTSDSTDDDLRILSATLLEHAHRTCRRRASRTEACDLTSSQLRTLTRIARLYDSHPDYDRSWSAFLPVHEG